MKLIFITALIAATASYYEIKLHRSRKAFKQLSRHQGRSFKYCRDQENRLAILRRQSRRDREEIQFLHYTAKKNQTREAKRGSKNGEVLAVFRGVR